MVFEGDEKWEVEPGFVGEQSPVKVDEQMATTIPGMYAAGDVCYDGSCAPGAVPAPPGRNRGSGILNAVFAGVVSGQQAAAYAADHAQQPIDDAQVAQLKEDAFAQFAANVERNKRAYVDKSFHSLEILQTIT